MEQQDMLATVQNLMNAINRGDLDTALNCYEREAVLVVQPGKICCGRDEIRAALEGFIALKPTLKSNSYNVVNAGTLALYCSNWVLVGTTPDGKRVEMSGVSSDVLRQQPDGKWLVAIDNPWGSGIIR